MKKLSIILALFGLVFFFTACDDDDNNDVKEPELTVKSKIRKQHDDALLVVTFGSTWEEPHKTYKNMIERFKAEFPDKDVYLSFTAKTCITRWGARTGEYFFSPELWLNALGEAGYKDITVQSMHVIPGEEFIILRDEYVGEFKENYPNIPIRLGNALLTSQEDIHKVGDVLLKAFKSKLDAGEAIAFMGHGNPKKEFIDGFDGKPHGVNQCYYDILNYMNAKYPKIFVGTVDYEPMLIEPTLEKMKEKLDNKGVVNLFPLMSIAGDHANNDMAGNEDDSWKVMMRKAGYTINKDNIVLKGLADYPEILDVWISHTKAILKK